MIGAATTSEQLAPTEATEAELAQVTGQQEQELDPTEMRHSSLSLSIYPKAQTGTTSSPTHCQAYTPVHASRSLNATCRLSWSPHAA